MLNIKKLNAISGVIYDLLPKESYNVSSELEDCDAYIVRSADCHSIEFPKDLAAIARAGAGVNNIPLDKCTEKGIVVFNTPGANANGVKELVLCAMFMASRNVVDAVEWAKKLDPADGEIAKQVEKGKKQFVGPELKGKTIGVIGLGAIGILVANAAAAIGMKVIGYDPYLSVENAWTISNHTKRVLSLDELLSESDYVTIHVPFIKGKTENYISGAEFSKMKKGAVLLNLARGGLVKTSSLKEALENGTVSKYVTDFPDESVLGLDGVICIPHLGASTPESEENCAVMAAQELRSFFETGSIKNSVNMPECLVGPIAESTKRITIIHKNAPNMVGQITKEIAEKGSNIADMVNKSRGDIAYTVLNIDGDVPADVLDAISKIDGVVRLRVIG
ncbi:MAG: phosphoglycerate dehydrogenase [Christensenellaceae bacterium]|nr:phosphoglycerate dehydrogenase [Christensenellaceae bacterium]